MSSLRMASLIMVAIVAVAPQARASEGEKAIIEYGRAAVEKLVDLHADWRDQRAMDKAEKFQREKTDSKIRVDKL